jgi:putative MATE family efflux protein
MQRFKKLMTAIDMTEGTPWKKLVLFAIPLLIGNLFQQLYSTVDAIMLGYFIGDTALAAVGSSMPLLFLIIILCMGVAVGAGIMVSQYFGAKDRDALSHTIGTSVTVITLVGLVIMAAGPFIARPMLVLMSTPAEILDDSVLYMNVLLYGVLSIAYYNILSGVLRSLGDSFSPLLYLIISSLLNIVFNYFFIGVLGMGVYGAALGTVIVQFISCALCLRRLMRMRDVFDFSLRCLIPKKLYVAQVLKLGVPTAAAQGIIAVAAMFVQPLVNSFGTLFIAANVILMRIDSFVMMPIFSFSNAITVFTGQNVGANRMDRVDQGAKHGLIITTSTIVALVACMLVCGPYIARLFTQTQEVIDFSTHLLRILLPWFIVFSFCQMLWGIIRGAGDAVSPMWASVAVTVVIRIPAAFLLVYLMGRPVALIYAMIAAWVINTVISVFVYRRGKWRAKGVVKKRPADDTPDDEPETTVDVS